MNALPEDADETHSRILLQDKITESGVLRQGAALFVWNAV
jgi:hypothetical protein